ncbi:MAG: hypothetical protein RIF46_17055 [Cyclobacteriaceae bacterium]
MIHLGLRFRYVMAIQMVIIIISTMSCSSKSQNFFIGKWQILSVTENDQQMDLNNNWIQLNSDDGFVSYDGNSGKSEAGNWIYYPAEKTLSINESNGEESGESSWKLMMRNDTLIFSSTEKKLYLKAIRLY